jgi:hypothetical protein
MSVSPPCTQREGATPSCGGGGGGPNSDDWLESLALCILCGARPQKDSKVQVSSFFSLRIPGTLCTLGQTQGLVAVHGVGQGTQYPEVAACRSAPGVAGSRLPAAATEFQCELREVKKCYDCIFTTSFPRVDSNL